MSGKEQMAASFAYINSISIYPILDNIGDHHQLEQSTTYLSSPVVHESWSNLDHDLFSQTRMEIDHKKLYYVSYMYGVWQK